MPVIQRVRRGAIRRSVKAGALPLASQLTEDMWEEGKELRSKRDKEASGSSSMQSYISRMRTQIMRQKTQPLGYLFLETVPSSRNHRSEDPPDRTLFHGTACIFRVGDESRIILR